MARKTMEKINMISSAAMANISMISTTVEVSKHFTTEVVK